MIDEPTLTDIKFERYAAWIDDEGWMLDDDPGNGSMQYTIYRISGRLGDSKRAVATRACSIEMMDDDSQALHDAMYDLCCRELTEWIVEHSPHD